MPTELFTSHLWVVVGGILIASAAYYGALQALRTFLDDRADAERRSDDD